ncbi:hypothetical protein GCM10010497_23270 [Streptomyces cinereoruber]|uniref:Uncharacterized protein n=1 Tax=Streptomyces cinereoruber TaxID=67260 RepID=A0AAV4KJ27_9ACTN|nr:hypothetical protein GCM10010497_23270 [Streptomyces cinereoruber]
MSRNFRHAQDGDRFAELPRLGPVNGAVRTPHDVKPSSRQAGTAGTNPPFHCEGPAGGHEVASRSGSSPPAHSEAVIRRAAVGTMVRRPTHGRPATRSGPDPSHEPNDEMSNAVLGKLLRTGVSG